MNSKNNNREPEEEEHNTGADRYLVTYADLITLLLGLFVVLYAAGAVDQSKFKALSKAFTQYFRAESPKVLEGGSGVLEGNRKGVPEAILMPSNPKSMEEFEKEARQSLAGFISRGEITVKRTNAGLVLVFPERLLFKSGRAEVQPEGITALDSISGALNNINFQISIDGHTDSDPIRSFQYESNWHLSNARALNVAYYLIGRGMPEQNLRIAGYGSQRPVADNSSAEGKARNRRVEITISTLTPGAPTVAGDTAKGKSAGR